jgi:two-component system sensor histidine kinase GlrK
VSELPLPLAGELVAGAGPRFVPMPWYRRRPRLVVQLFLANLLALLPLLIAIVYALTTLERHQQRQQVLLFSASDSTRVVVSLADQVKEVERSARQLIVLQDQRFVSVLDGKLRQYEVLRTEAAATLAPAVTGNLLDELTELMAATRELATHDESSGKSGTLDATLMAQFERSAQAVAELRQRNQHWLGAQMRALTSAQTHLQRQLMLWALLALPLTVALAIIATMLISRPMDALSEAMERLGVGDWKQPVVIGGPRDIVQLAQRLDWLRQQLIETDTQKKSLMRNITHELKTPLAAINEAAALLTDQVAGPLTEQQMRVTTILSNNVTVLRQMIEQLLFYNALALPSKPRIVQLKFPQIIEEWCARFEDLRARKQITFAFEGPAQRVRLDTHRTELIVTNLLTNALKYSPPRGVISIRWSFDDSSFRVDIADQGPGIADAEKQSIFEPLYRGAAAPDALAMPGSGMGLAIARECALQMRASISVENVSPHGARFSVVIPYEQ